MPLTKRPPNRYTNIPPKEYFERHYCRAKENCKEIAIALGWNYQQVLKCLAYYDIPRRSGRVRLLDAVDAEELSRLYVTRTTRQMAAYYGVNKRTVILAMKRCGVTLRTNSQLKHRFDKNEVERLYADQHMSIDGIAAVYSVSRSVIRGFMMRSGIRIRHGGDIITVRSAKGQAKTYSGLHARVYAVRGKAGRCEMCGSTTAKRYHWANISGRYDDVWDYKAMCVTCHYAFDRQRITLSVPRGIAEKEEDERCKCVLAIHRANNIKYFGDPQFIDEVKQKKP